MRSVAEVRTPIVPSEPTRRWRSPGPAAWLGTGSVETNRPGGRATSAWRTRSSALPYFVDRTPDPRAASQPPTVAPKWKDPGSWATASPRGDGPASSWGPVTPASTVTTRLVSSTSMIRSIRVRSMEIPPYRAKVPPCVPEPPPRGTTGTRWSLAMRSTLATSWALPGRTITSAIGQLASRGACRAETSRTSPRPAAVSSPGVDRGVFGADDVGQLVLEHPQSIFGPGDQTWSRAELFVEMNGRATSSWRIRLASM